MKLERIDISIFAGLQDASFPCLREVDAGVCIVDAYAPAKEQRLRTARAFSGSRHDVMRVGLVVLGAAGSGSYTIGS